MADQFDPVYQERVRRAMSDLGVSGVPSNADWARISNRVQELEALAAGPAGNKSFVKAVSQMTADDMLRARPELRPYYERVLQQARDYAAGGGDMKIPNNKSYKKSYYGQSGPGSEDWFDEESHGNPTATRYVNGPEELAWNWLFGNVSNLGAAGMGVEARPLTAPPSGLYEMLSDPAAGVDQNANKSWWERKGQPGLAQGLTFASMLPGLNPLGALGKGLGTMFGSKIAGQALAGAAGSAITGGDPLRGGLSAIAGGLSGKFSDALGEKTGGAVAGGLSSLASGGNPLQGVAAGYLGGGAANDNKNGGGGDMGDFNLKSILGPAVAGALMNRSSAETGAAAGAALGLLGSTGFGAERSRFDGVLNLALQGYLANKLQGGNGGQGAMAGAGSSIYNNYIANGTNDDALRAMLGINGLVAGTGGYGLDSIVSGGQGMDWEKVLRDGVERLLDQYLGGSAEIGSAAPAAGVNPGYRLPDILSLYRNYYNQLPASDGGGYDDVLKRRYDAARGLLNDDYMKQSGRLDADLNRRGLFSSGIALAQQEELRNQLMNALSREAGQTALGVSNARADAEKQRRDQAMEFAKLRLSELMKSPESATAAELSDSFGASPVAAEPAAGANGYAGLKSMLGGALDVGRRAGVANMGMNNVQTGGVAGLRAMADAVRGSFASTVSGSGGRSSAVPVINVGLSTAGGSGLFNEASGAGQRLFSDVYAKFNKNPVFSYGAGSKGSQLVFR